MVEKDGSTALLTRTRNPPARADRHNPVSDSEKNHVLRVCCSPGTPARASMTLGGRVLRVLFFMA